MANSQHNLWVRQFERECEAEIEAAIETTRDRLEQTATERFRGRLVEFTHRWHSIDPETTTIRAHIDRIIISVGDGGNVHVELGVRVQDPRTGRTVNLERYLENCHFVE